VSVAVVVAVEIVEVESLIVLLLSQCGRRQDAAPPLRR
jgi:hypothetical protein